MKECIDLITDFSHTTLDDLKLFLKMATSNFIIGNCDAHGKNFSFLYDPQLSTRPLAPFYDITSSSIGQRFDQDMAMRLGRNRKQGRISKQGFEDASPKKLMDMIIEELLATYPKALASLTERTGDDLRPLLQKIADDSQKHLASLRPASSSFPLTPPCHATRS